MSHRHYGLRPTKSRDTYTGPARAGAWSGSAFLGAMLVMLIVLGVVLFGVVKTITHAENTTTSAPHTTGDGTAR